MRYYPRGRFCLIIGIFNENTNTQTKMVNPLPPPKNYRAKTRLARCRARQEAKKSSSGSNKNTLSSKKESWVPFNAVPELSSSWSGECEELENRESVEVAITESLPLQSSPAKTWVSAPIGDHMGNLPVIPLPAPSSISHYRNLRNSNVPPLQQRDTNTLCRSVNLPETMISHSTLIQKNSPRRKLVSRPIESSRGRGLNPASNASRRTRSSSRTVRGRSKSLVNERRLERTISDSSTSQGSRETVQQSNQGKNTDDSSSRRRSRSRNRRERSLSIIRARRFIKDTTTSRARSLSVAPSRSNTVQEQYSIIGNNRSNPLSSPESRCSRASQNSAGPALPQSNRRGFSIDSPTRNQQRDHNVRERGANTEPQSRQGMLNSASTAPMNTFEAMNRLVSLPNPIHTRTLLTSSVYNNEATGIWITTINMNQKSNVTKSNAAKYLKAFSFATEREARESAYANAPAKLLPIQEHPRCFSCDAKFGVLRRASHCRNCGVVICNSCCVNWSKQSIPETFNVKNENVLKVCKSCDSLSKMFRQSLVEADYDKALTIYNTGNINLRCQFMSVKGSEAMLPIHCAAEGGNLQFLKCLVDVHHCPIKRIRTSNKNRTQTTNELITTSKGRNVLEIAMASKSVDVMNYLVNAKKVSFHGIRSIDVALNALHAVLLAYPQRSDLDDEEEQSEYGSPATCFTRSPATSITPLDRQRHTPIRNGIPLYDVNSEDTDDESSDTSYQSVNNDLGSDDEQSVATTVHDAVSVSFILFLF